MKIVETTSGLAELANVETDCVLTIGNFDGVHLGHQEILAAAKKAAAQKQTQLVVMTFEPHPAAVLHPEKAPGVLTPLKLKEHLLAQYGVDCLTVLKDSYRILNLSPAAFVEEFLVKNAQPAVVVEGVDFNFGYGRSGNVDTLKELAAEFDFQVIVVACKETKLSDGKNEKVSSTLIRHLLHKGKVADASLALGRHYRLSGQTVPGMGKGRQLGFPTANINPVKQIIPAEGVYAGFVEIADSEEQLCNRDEKIPAAFSIGRAKTFISDHPLLVEAHILERDIGYLYDKWLAMDFVEHLRGQQKFETEKDLAAQIAKDCEKAKGILTAQRCNSPDE
ncbi:MAG: bifunctional riboflavin kinase/FAD synthetase [Planctomycetota bacterium]